MSVNIAVKWADNTPELVKNLKQGTNEIELTKASVEKEPTVPSTSRAMNSSITERAMAVPTNPSPWSACTITQTAFGSVRSP